jgi:hypothetical protein
VDIGKVLAAAVLVVILYLAALGRLPAVWYSITRGDPLTAIKSAKGKKA